MNKRNFIVIPGASLLTAAAFAKNPMVGGKEMLPTKTLWRTP